jgi:hypothetical protein
VVEAIEQRQTLIEVGLRVRVLRGDGMVVGTQAGVQLRRLRCAPMLVLGHGGSHTQHQNRQDH